jgi:predicted DCC family thiol-disulfide oxidoreductase YuxK
MLVPRPIRDAVYNLVARNRYRWFGKQEACWLPRPEWRHRFIDHQAD